MSDPQPIEVQGSMKADAGLQAVRYGLVLACGVIFNHFVESEVLTGAFVAFVGAVLIYGWGFITSLRQHRKLKAMAALLPDEKAVVK